MVSLAAIGASTLLGGCVVNEATGESRLSLAYMSREQQIALGAEAQPALTEEYGGKTPSAPVQAYVTEIGAKLAKHTEADNPSLPWEFTLLDSPVINAFALPGGKVFMSRGLAEKMTNEAQLAGVLGHEIGHVTAEHADKRITNQIIFAGVLIGASVAAGQSDDDLVSIGVPLLVGAGGTGFLLKFGRGEEYESDELGMRYMSKAGYTPDGQARVMQVLANASDGPRQWEMLSTHPFPENRVKRAREIIRKEYPETIDNPSYGFYQDEYQRRMLEPLRKLPPAKQRVQQAQ
jgi:predicted Zn-dependent protease